MAYGDYVSLMSHTVKARYAEGDLVFREGEPADAFLLLLGGTADVLQRQPDGSQRRVNQLAAGDFFGETALLTDAPRNATVRCTSDAEVLKLSRADFQAGFLGGAARDRVATKARDGDVAGAQQTLGFIRMVSRMQRSSLQCGQHAFREGDPADRFFLLAGGEVQVEGRDGRPLARLSDGDCFGEMELMLSCAPRSASVRCVSGKCELLSLARDDFLKLMRRSTALHGDMMRLAAARHAAHERSRATPAGAGLRGEAREPERGCRGMWTSHQSDR